MTQVYTNIIPKKQTREAQLNALKILDAALTNSYGPNGSTTAIRKKNDVARYTKDGHTILCDIKFNKPIEQTMRDDLRDITVRIVSTIGDGTTSAIKASYLIFDALKTAHEKYGISELELVKQFKKAIEKAIKIIDSNKKETTVDDIYKIAMISTNGNEEVAQNLSDIYKENGMEVFIDVGISNSPNNVKKVYDGFTIEEGYCDPAFINNTERKVASIRGANIYVFEDPIDTPEMSVFLDKIMYDNIFADKTNIVPTVIFCPKISVDMNAMMDNIVTQLTNIKPMMRPPLLVIPNIFDGDVLSDLAIISGAKPIKKYIDPTLQQMDIDNGLAATPDTVHNFAGYADLVEADNLKTKIINPKLMFNEDGEKSDTYNGLIDGLQMMLEKYEEAKEDIVKVGTLKRRINSLKANMVDYLVGGISMNDRDALRDLVEDAVLNCRSAAKDGTGFGANFEAFRAFNELEKLEMESLSEEEHTKIQNEEAFSIYTTLNKVYLELVSSLYFIHCGEDKTQSILTALECLANGCPLNIRTEKFDNTVLSTIKSDQVILDAISKIIGLVISTNQYLCEAPEYNVYIDPE